MKPDKRLSIANSYGSVDCRNQLPKAYVHIRGKRLKPLCRNLGIEYADALVDFPRNGRAPQFDGVVISRRSESKLLLAIEKRYARTAARHSATEVIKRTKGKRNQRRKPPHFVTS